MLCNKCQHCEDHVCQIYGYYIINSAGICEDYEEALNED